MYLKLRDVIKNVKYKILSQLMVNVLQIDVNNVGSVSYTHLDVYKRQCVY